MKNEQTKNTISANSGIGRRQFLKAVGLTTTAAAVGKVKLPITAGPFEKNEYLKIITEDKKLSPDWVASLYRRGKKQVYSNPRALGHIGMPVGGLFAGTVYLSGDGRLWLWDITEWVNSNKLRGEDLQ